MTPLQKAFSVATVLFLFFIIIFLVKRGKLREEYSWMWLLTGSLLLLIVLWYNILLFLTDLIGAILPTTTIFIFGIIFLVLLSLHFAIKISLLTHEVKNLAQKVSMLEAESEQSLPYDKEEQTS